MPAARALSFRIARSARKKMITVGNSTMNVTTAAFGKTHLAAERRPQFHRQGLDQRRADDEGLLEFPSSPRRRGGRRR